MEYDYKIGRQLTDELLDLYTICQKQCEKIGKTIMELNEKYDDSN